VSALIDDGHAMTAPVLCIHRQPGETIMTDNVTAVFRAYQQAADAHDTAKAHPDLGQKNAKGYAAKGRLQHAADVLREAGQTWEQVRLEHLARKEQDEAGAPSLPLDDPTRP
jgi:hypothetical protein